MNKKLQCILSVYQTLSRPGILVVAIFYRINRSKFWSFSFKTWNSWRANLPIQFKFPRLQVFFGTHFLRCLLYLIMWWGFSHFLLKLFNAISRAFISRTMSWFIWFRIGFIFPSTSLLEFSFWWWIFILQIDHSNSRNLKLSFFEHSLIYRFHNWYCRESKGHQ